jgi:hypothetical protein
MQRLLRAGSGLSYRSDFGLGDCGHWRLSSVEVPHAQPFAPMKTA